MINHIWVYIFFILITQSLQAQSRPVSLDTINLSGMYYSTNLYVYNPSVADSFSIQELIVNKDTIRQELATNGIEINLKTYKLEEGDVVDILIIYSGKYPPVIVNPEALMPPVRFRISKPRYTRNEELQWNVRGVPGDYPIIVEQYKWNAWRKVATVDPVDTVENNIYEIPVTPHSGKNIYRIKSTNIKGEEVSSRDLIFNSRKVQKVYIQNKKKKIESEIILSAKTEYEIYDLEGNQLLSGKDRYIKIDKLAKGNYLLFFDNQIQEFKKK